MLFEASMSRMAPLFDPPGGATARPDTACPLSVTSSFDAVSACLVGSVSDVRLVREPRRRRFAQLRRRALPEGEGGQSERGDRRARDRDPQSSLHAVAPRRSSSEWTRSPNMLCGSSMPRLRNFSRKTGRRPVGLEPARDRPVGRDRLDLELEDVLELDDVRLHAEHLGDRDDAPRAVLHAVDVHEQVERRRDVLADRAQRQVVAGHHHHRLDAVEAVTGRVRVHRGERPVVARVHRLEHVERLGAAHLADDDPVGAHAQRVAHEVADRDVALALDVRRASLEAEHVALVERELGGVLDRHDPLVVRDRRRERVQQRRLARARAARDEHVALGLDAAAQELDRLLRERADVDHVLHREAPAAELPDRQQRAGEGQRRDDRVHAADPSGRRASTIGDDSSMRRPICDTILLMMRRRCDSSVKRTVVS